MKAYNLVLSWVFQAKVFIFVFLYGCCAAILNHMVDIAHFLLGPHIRSFRWWKIVPSNDGADFGDLLQLIYKKDVVVGLCLCNFVFHAMAGTLKSLSSVTQTEALKNLLHLGTFFMPSSLTLLHTAMPTHCLNTFSHSNPDIFWKCFLSQVKISVAIFLVPYLLWRQTTPGSRCHRITRMNSTRFSRLWRSADLAIRTSLIPRRKAWERGDFVAMAVPRGCYVCACAQFEMESKAGAGELCLSLNKSR